MNTSRTLIILGLLSLVGATTTQPASAPSAGQNVSASIAIDGIRLAYQGPRTAPPRAPIMVSVMLHNESARVIEYTGAANPSRFKVSMKGPDGAQVGHTEVGAQEGSYYFNDGIGSLKPGEVLEQNFDVARWFNMTRAGTYLVTVSRSYDGVIILFPGQELKITDIPIEVKVAKTEKTKGSH